MQSSESSGSESKSSNRSKVSGERGKRNRKRASRGGKHRVSAKRQSQSNRGNKLSKNKGSKGRRGSENQDSSAADGAGRRRGRRGSKGSSRSGQRRGDSTGRSRSSERRSKNSESSQVNGERKQRLQRRKPKSTEVDASDLSNQFHSFSAPLSEFIDLSDSETALLAAAGVKTVSELLFTVPQSYHDRRKMTSSTTVVPGDEVVISGLMEARSVRVRFTDDSSEKWVVTDVRDGMGSFKAIWEVGNPRPELRDIPLGSALVLWGKAIEHKGEVVLVEPQLERLDQFDSISAHRSGFVPLYGLEGVPSSLLRELIHKLLLKLRGNIPEVLPGRHAMDLEEALWSVHFPDSESDLAELQALGTEAHDLVVRAELFIYALSLSLHHSVAGPDTAANIKVRHTKVAHFVNGLSAGLTDDQRAAFEDIKRDVLSRRPMNRLIQADMGAGKTVVAMLASLLVIENKQQVAFVVPTDVSAERRYSVLVDLLERIGVRCELLTSQVRGRKRDRLLGRLRKGDIDIVIGTENLFHETVQFRRLGLVVVEEQQIIALKHRRGGSRRGVKPHLLVLTASPVPTPIAYLKYGDLQTSRLSEKPNGRAKMETHVYGNDQRDEACRLFAELLGEHKQGFVLHSRGLKEEGFAALKETLLAAGFPADGIVALPDIINVEERESTLQSFKERKIQLLLLPLGEEDSLDTSNVSGILVDGAEGCALTYLNKLRVMAEFGAHDGGCVYVVSGPDAETETKRIAFLQESSDGFQLATLDLAQRGLRAFLGGNLSDLPNFQVVDLDKHLDRLEGAIAEARRWEARNPDWQSQAKHTHLRAMIEERWGDANRTVSPSR